VNRQSVQSGIHRAWDVINSAGLAETFSNPAPLPVSEEFRKLVLSDASYITVYLAGLRLSHYNFLLADYSYFQFSVSNDDHVRYAYLPNPFAHNIADFKRRQELVDAGMVTQEEYLGMLADTRGDYRIPIIRYENAPDQHKGLNHPCSHFHIGHHSENRWPIRRLLTPFAFVLLIIKQYYGDAWRETGDDESDAFGNKFENDLVRERSVCRVIGTELFTEAEERSFHFS
jgi:hypothetical protein